MNQWRGPETGNLVVNIHNEGVSPARSWLGSNRPGLTKEKGWEFGWIGELGQVL